MAYLELKISIALHRLCVLSNGGVCCSMLGESSGGFRGETTYFNPITTDTTLIPFFSLTLNLEWFFLFRIGSFYPSSHDLRFISESRSMSSRSQNSQLDCDSMVSVVTNYSDRAALLSDSCAFNSMETNN